MGCNVQHRKMISSVTATLDGTDSDRLTVATIHPTTCANVKPLGVTPKTNTMYVNYISITILKAVIIHEMR